MLEILDVRLNLLVFRLFLEMRCTLLGAAELADKALILQGALRNALADTHHLMQATIEVQAINPLPDVLRPIISVS